jgi:hypothetical protein
LFVLALLDVLVLEPSYVEDLQSMPELDNDVGVSSVS